MLKNKSEKEKTLKSDIKQLLDNFTSLAVLKIANLVLPFVTLPYLIKTLGFEKYGVIVISLALMQYFQAFTDYGFNLSATRDIAIHKHSKSQLSFIYRKVFSSKVILLVFSISILLPIIAFTPQFNEHKELYILMLFMLIGYTLFPIWFFRGIEKMRYITILDLTVKVFFTIGVFIFIRGESDYWIYGLLNGAGFCSVAFISNYLICKRYQVKFRFVNIKYIKKTLKAGFPLFINQFAPNLYNNTTNFLVGMILGSYSAGVFGAVRQIVNLLSVLNSVISTVMFPYLNRNKGHFDNYRVYYLVAWIIISTILLALYKFIFHFLGITDAVAAEALVILVFGMFFIVINSIYATNYLLVYKYDKLVMHITLKVSLVGFLIAYPAILYFGILGASATIFIAQLLLGVMAYLAYKKIIEKGDMTV